ncbi:zinc ribbon domain-containing protein [Candidatus Dependentiae bacterium]|nr:zinc ribbon domain-containing protein [Candidatus Dependentiae bacterium]
MPIYEYSCNKCGNNFEILTNGKEKIFCNKCSSPEITKKFSVFGIGNSSKNSSSYTNCDSSQCGTGYCPAMTGSSCGCPSCH